MTRGDGPAPAVNWGRIYHDLARDYGWTPDQVNDMTLSQLAAIRSGGDAGVVTLNPIQARMFFQSRKKG